MNIKVLKSWTLRVAVFGLLINEPLLSHAFEITQDTNFSSPTTTLEDNQPLPSRPIEIDIYQYQTVLSLITTLREIDNAERKSPYKDCYYNSDFSIFDDNCELKDKNELLTYISEGEFEKIVQSLPSKDNIPAVSYLSDKELVRLEETLDKLIERGTISVLPLRRLLKDDSQLLRESAIYALSEISRSSKLVRPGTEQLLIDRSSKLAILGIEKLLLEVLLNDESPAVRDRAAFALAQIKPLPEVIDALIKNLFDNQKPTKVRQHAGQLLNEISLDNISLESVNFLVEKTNNLTSNLRENECLNFTQEYRTHAQGVTSDSHVASLISKEDINMLISSKTCLIQNNLNLIQNNRANHSPGPDLYQAIKKWLFGCNSGEDDLEEEDSSEIDGDL